MGKIRTYGRSSGSGKGCLCKNSDTYSPKCCGETLLGQGIGNIGSTGGGYSGRYEIEGGVYIGPTHGNTVPRDNSRGCLCLDKETYSIKCCQGHLMNQGIGSIYGSTGIRKGAFSNGFSNGFDAST